MPTPVLSIICPAYNEQDAISSTVADIVTHVLTVVPEAELIVVNDGSKDGTGPILDGLAAGEPRLRVIHQENAGHGPAVRRGMDEARGQWLFLIDSDRQMPLDRFGMLWSAAQEYDAAFGIREHRDDPRVRLVLTRVIRVVVMMMFGTRLRDLNVPYKVFRREVWASAKPFVPPGTLAPSLFLAIVASAQGRRIAQVGVPHLPRTTGVVSIRRWKLFKFCTRALGQLLALRLRLLFRRGSA